MRIAPALKEEVSLRVHLRRKGKMDFIAVCPRFKDYPGRNIGTGPGVSSTGEGEIGPLIIPFYRDGRGLEIIKSVKVPAFRQTGGWNG
jgi:hypothetical protein